MNNRLIWFLYFSLLFTACRSLSNIKNQDYYNVAVKEFLLNSTDYFPINNLIYMEKFQEQKITDDCLLDIDSIKQKYFVSDQYGSKSLSPYKQKSIYLNLLENCYPKSELRVNIIRVDKLSKWASEQLTKYNTALSNIENKKWAEVQYINGIPYELHYYKKAEELINNSEKYEFGCTKFLEVSSLFKFSEYLCIEISSGCIGVSQNIGRQHTLYIFTLYQNELIIDNKLRTNYKF